MVGDAFGFVDPMLSPGVFLALRSAELVAEALNPVLRRGTTPSPAELASALRSYATVQAAMLAAWSDLVAYLYDGRMLALLRSGRGWVDGGSTFLKSAAQRHIERHIALQASGVRTTSRYSRGLLRLRASRAEPRDERQDLLEVDPDEPPGHRGARSRDLEEQEASARLQDPSALPQSHFQIGHVAKSVSHAQEIEVLIAERQFLHSSLHQRD